MAEGRKNFSDVLAANRARQMPAPARTLLTRVSAGIERLPRAAFKRGNQMALDSIVAAVAMLAAYMLRFEGHVPAYFARGMWLWVMLFSVARPISTLIFTRYRSIWRYLHLQDVMALALAAMPPTIGLLMVRLNMRFMFWMADVPLSIVLLEYGCFVTAATAMRALRRATFEASKLVGTTRMRALLVGTEETLAGAVRHVALFPDLEIIGLVTPEEHLHGLFIAAQKVIASPAQLPELLVRHSADAILIADSSLDCVASTVAVAAEYGVEVRLLPSAANVMRGEVRVNTPIKPEHAFSERAVIAAPAGEVVCCYSDKTVLITGAGGSIGSEICRQVARLGVAKLVMLDNDENSIFEMTNELAAIDSEAEIISVVGDIRDRTRLYSVFSAHRPQIVLHAAAYKHVPVMEQNPSEAVLNNVIGTRELAEVAVEFEAERFLMISTDKAVHPTSIMGASKRVAEMMIQHRAAATKRSTRFACVRFGNVVGSRGSVIPIFLKQIAAGQPLTITDEQMTRYFMTIPEAVQLVLQASTLGSDGDIYMLDMGDPMKIVSLARKLVEMSGLVPDKDIPIKIVGIRPGEKLHEQLWLEDANIAKTDFQRVWAVRHQAIRASFLSELEELERVALARLDDQAALGVMQIAKDTPRTMAAGV